MIWNFDKVTVVEKIADNLFHLEGEADLLDKNENKCGRLIVDMPRAFIEEDGITLLENDAGNNKRPLNREERRRAKFNKK